MLIANLGTAQGFDPYKQVKEARMRAAAVRAARVDALRQLGEAIKGVKISSTTTVKDFVTQSDQIKAQFNGMLQGAQQVEKPKVYDDGIVELKMVIYVDAVIYGLKNIARNNYSKISANQIEKIKKFAGKKFEAVGTGAMAVQPSPKSNVDLWRYVGIRGRLMARRAAQMDAYRSIGEAIYGVQINAQTTVKDFVTQSDQIKSSFNGIVRGVQISRRVVYRPDGLAEVTATLDVDTLIKFLKYMSRFGNNNFSAQSIENLRYYFPNGKITATGVGAPPARYIRKSPRYRSIAKESNYDRIDGEYKPKLAQKDDDKIKDDDFDQWWDNDSQSTDSNQDNNQSGQDGQNGQDNNQNNNQQGQIGRAHV